MKTQNTFPRLPFALLTGFSIAANALFPISSNAGENGDLATLGLVTHWESNIGGAPLANGPKSFVIWPHTTEKREFVTVKSGNRIIERINGNEINLAAVEQAVLNGEKLDKPPMLGLEGATKKAQKLVANYKVLGRQAEIEPYSQRLVYAVTLTTNGILETIDAETGSVIWKTEVGKSTLPMFGPGVSDDYVAAINGNSLFVYDLANGNMVLTRNLMYTATAAPTVLLGKVIVPSVDGRLVSYDIKSTTVAPAIIRNGVENRLGTTISADHQFLAWPTGSKLVLARMEKEGAESSTKLSATIPKLWSSVTVNEHIEGAPIATQDGFIAATVNGTVMHCSTNRGGTLLWKTRLAVHIVQSPLANKEVAFVLSDDGFLYALRMSDGAEVWGHQPSNIKSLIAIGKQHIYVKDSRNTLVAIDLGTGLEAARSQTILPLVVPNSISDRLFFVSQQGQVTCLRETNAKDPTYLTDYTKTVSPTIPAADKPAAEKTNSSDSDSNPFGGAEAPDPFAADPN